MSLNILFLTHAEALYGAERCLVEITKYLDRSMMTPFVALPQKCLFADRFENEGVKIVEFHAESLSLNLSTAWRIFKYNLSLISCCLKNQIKIVHFNLTAHVETLLLFYTWAFFRGVRIFFHQRSPISFSALERIILSSHYCLCVSEAIRQQLLAPRKSDVFARFDPKRVIALHDGNELSRFDAPSQPHLRKMYAEDSEKIVGIVSAIDQVKRLELFLNTAALVVRDFPQTKFIVIGDIRAETQELLAYRKELMQLRDSLGLRQHVQFLGFKDDIPSYYAMLDIFLLTSQRETLGGVLIEAMASGKPVVSSAVDGTVEVVDHGKTGFLIHSSEPQAYANALLDLLKNDDLRMRFGMAGKKRAEDMFDIRKQILKLQNIYLSTIGKNPL